MARGMTHDELDDLIGYIRWASRNDCSAEEILCNVVHDLVGIRADEPGFAPRTSGYALKGMVS
jgi:hypothetical protein